MQRRAIVAGNAEAHALRCESQSFNRARVLEFLGLAVGEAHEGALANAIGDGALGTCGDTGYPFPAGRREFLDHAIGLDRKHLAVLAAGHQPVIGRVVESGQQPVIGLNGLVTVVQPVHGAVGEGEMRHVVKEDGGDAMAIDIKRGDCRHQAEFRANIRMAAPKNSAPHRLS